MKTEVQCFAHYGDRDTGFDEGWLTKVLNLWIETKKAFLTEKFSVAEFRKRLEDGIINAACWENQFRDAYEEAGGDPNSMACTKAYRRYVRENRGEAFRLVPYGAHTEFRWIPEWTWGGLDEVIDTHGLRTDCYNSNYLENLLPGEWLTRFLRLVNVSSMALGAAARATRGAEGKLFAERMDAAGLFVPLDLERPAIMDAEQVIAALENAYTHAVLCVHAEIEVRALLELDPSKSFVLSTDKKQQVSVGFHCFVNGAGYMDTYHGEVTVPAAETGFTGADRWAYGIDKTYCLYKPAFYTTPRCQA